ncbi:MAG TPA: iron-sulfur cluster assembly scaffold protein [Thermomicrobiales bacterium]|nr:iron-sulfur cluster assembly scaffold protein [Thermomicrobiales bacterium]
MDRQAQIEFILDHYENPRNHGKMEGADVVSEGGNPGCGDMVTIYLKVDPERRVERVTFEGQGCTISQAAASLVTEMIEGKPLDEVLDLSYDAIVDELGRDVVMSRPRCATLALGTVKAAIDSYQKGERAAKIEV